MLGRRKKVLVALSGGIDSAVSAYLLIKQGYEVEAAFMKNWSSTKGLVKNECPWLADRQDALRVAAFLRIPLHTLDFEKEYQKRVMDYFFKEYRAGRTPNPDVMCNKEIKFKLLYNWAIGRGFDYLATGHYARIGLRAKRQGLRNVSLALSAACYKLERSADEFKDQTYFIYNIKQEQLPHILFPIGNMKKTQVRALAQKIGLPNAEKKESMGLCFVGKIRLKDFLEQKLKPNPGAILDQNGKKIGEHGGLHNFTIGQRQGVKVGATGPYYVTRKDLKTNTLYVTNDPGDKALETKEVEIHSVNWINKNIELEIKNTESGIKLRARYRHQGDLVPLVVKARGKDCYGGNFSKPQKAVASGQSLVLYNEKECVGGGVIV
ncbi:MAG: tRNA 2-thiouridine(34) synthase MnmA [Patescibacteria group bacterium]|nr:tRNA 2-thiouridine(34) synthase MnmA [Patescibacteria group bacterium]